MTEDPERNTEKKVRAWKQRTVAAYQQWSLSHVIREI